MVHLHRVSVIVMTRNSSLLSSKLYQEECLCTDAVEIINVFNNTVVKYVQLHISRVENGAVN